MLDKKTVKEELEEIAKAYTTSPFELKTDIRNDLALTSFDLIALIGEIEEKYSIQITEEDIFNITTVEDLVNFVYKKTK